MPVVLDIEAIRLDSGSHASFEDGVCVMELASVLGGRAFSDHPPCVSPVVGAFVRSWNDALDDERRQMLKPYAAKVLGTKTTRAAETKRAWFATDWLARECAPAFLRLAGLTQHAETLEGLVALAGARQATAAQPSLVAARAAAWVAARAAAWVAAGAAAGAAARAAARAALAPTVVQLQSSALLLLDRMIAA